MVILDELDAAADGLLEFGLVKTLEEETTLVTEHLGLDEVDVRDGEGCRFHLVDLLF